MVAPGQPKNADFPGEFIPSTGEKDCTDRAAWGEPSTLYSYIFKGNADQANYPEDACPPWYHKTAQIDGLQINSPGITGSGNINISGTVTASQVTASGVTLTSRKPFDIPHPTKPGHRLRHVCLEGPESGVYYRGRLTNSTVIELPDYWVGLVDPETITVTLTQIGSSQDLIVDKIEWGKKILIRSGNASAIDCYFMVNGERKDGEKLIVEYEGTSIDDYPGDNSIYSINK
jgi:hypothetical protein